MRDDRWEREGKVPHCCVCEKEITNYCQAMLYHIKCWHQEEDERAHRIKGLIRENPDNYDRSLDTAFLILEEFIMARGNDMGAVWQWTASAKLKELQEKMLPVTSVSGASELASEGR